MQGRSMASSKISVGPAKMLRGVDNDLWRRVRIEAMRREWTVGELVTKALSEWLITHEGGKEIDFTVVSTKQK